MKTNAQTGMAHSCQDQVNTPYEPASKNPFSLQVVTPCNMGFEVQKALHEIQRVNGDIDTYVRVRLGYANNKALYQRLSAEQIDAAAMAINQIERGEALIIGDQTGIGKGRVAASIVRYAVNQGKIPIFITEKSNLFSDIYRDLVDIGSESLTPFIFNTDSKAKIVDESGHVVHQPLSNDTQKGHLEGASALPRDFDFVATTYSQLSSDKLAIQEKEKFLGTNQKRRKTFPPQYKTEFIRAIASHAIFILDESHNAGGSVSNIGFFIREVIAEAQGVVYLSATFAKRPDNMPTYGIRTALREANLSQTALINAVNKGGVALQEIIASELVSVGQMVRRQRTYDGIKVEYRELKRYKSEHTQIYDAVTEIVRAIIDFQKKYIDKVVDEMDEAVREGSGGSAQTTKGTRGAGVDNVTYFSKVHLVVDQLLFALKAEQVADLAIELLAQNKKPVIAFKNTMGSFLEGMGYVDGDLVENIDFALTLQGALEGIMKYTTRDHRGVSKTEKIELHDLGFEAQDAYRDISKKIKEVSSGITISPIDIIIERIENSPRAKGVAGDSPYYKVAEVTGRKQRIVTEDELPVVRNFKSNINKSFRQFNNGEIDVVLINQTGATGGSLHSSDKFRDKRQRAMIIHQMELNINTEMQKRGRVNRTGQVNKPEYYYLTTSIPAEKRLMMAAKAKLKSLDANTTASQKANESQLDQVDFFNKYGGEMIMEYLQDNPNLNERLGKPIGKVNYNEDEEEKKGRFAKKKGIKLKDIPKKVTGRIAILPVADQETFYNKVLQKYLDYIDLLKRRDEYDLEAEFLALEAKTLDKFIAIGGSGGYSSFGTNAYLEVVRAKNTRKPYKMSHIEELIEETLDGLAVEEYHRELLDYFKYSYPKIVEEKLTPQRRTLDELKDKQQREQQRLADQKTKMDEAERAYTAEQDPEKKPQLQEVFIEAKKKWSKTSGNVDTRANKITDAIAKISNTKKELDMGKEILSELFEEFYPSRIFAAPLENEKGEPVESYALFIGFDVDREVSNPFAPSNLKMIFVFSDNRVYNKQGYNSGIAKRLLENPLNKTQEAKAKAKWNSMGSSEYVTAGIVTGNIITAINNSQFGGKIIKYSTHDGKIKAGLFQRGTAKPEETKGVKPIGSALDDVLSLEMGKTINGAGIELRLENSNQIFYTCYVSSNKLHEKFYKDEQLRQLLQGTPEEVEAGELPSFRQTGGGELKGEIPKINIKKFVQLLHDKHKVMVESGSLQKVAVNPEPTSAPTANGVTSTYRYELSSTFSASTQPSQGLIDNVPAAGSVFGHVIYNRALTDKERYEYGLIPIYASANEIYKKWENAISPATYKILKKAVGKAKKQSYQEAINTLGSFIANHPHESGNYEFIFGKFSEQQLGEVFYKDWIGEPKADGELVLFKKQLSLLLGLSNPSYQKYYDFVLEEMKDYLFDEPSDLDNVLIRDVARHITRMLLKAESTDNFWNRPIDVEELEIHIDDLLNFSDVDDVQEHHELITEAIMEFAKTNWKTI